MTIPKSFAGPRRHAAYTFAGQSSLHKLMVEPISKVRSGSLPAWMATHTDLDFLDSESPLFHTDRALFSFGQYLHNDVPPGMFSPRPGVTILGDSGGFQFIASPQKWAGDATREWFVSVMGANADEGMTLDVPTGAIDPMNPACPWPTFEHALDDTRLNLDFIDKRGVNARLLNVQQGRDIGEARAWYNATKGYRFGGWAFGGAMREDITHVVRLLAWLRRDGLLTRDLNRVHILGQASLRQAVAFSAIQAGVREAINDEEFLITFDTSTPNYLLVQGQALGFPKFGPRQFGSTYWKPPSHYRNAGSTAAWPIQSSAIGAKMTIGDLCVLKKQSIAQSAWDRLGDAMIANHNVHTHLWSIQMANELLELPPDDARQIIPGDLVDACDALRQCFRYSDPLSYLRPFATQLGEV